MSKYSGKRAIVVGASSGIGREVARLLLRDGWTVGLVARRGALLEALASECSSQAPASVSPSGDNGCGKTFVREIDVTSADADTDLRQLIDEMGGLDLYFHAAGVGWMNRNLRSRWNCARWLSMAWALPVWWVRPIAISLPQGMVRLQPSRR